MIRTTAIGARDDTPIGAASGCRQRKKRKAGIQKEMVPGGSALSFPASNNARVSGRFHFVHFLMTRKTKESISEAFPILETPLSLITKSPALNSAGDRSNTTT